MEVPDILNFKIIVVGFQGAGKSSLISRYIKGEFLENYNVTVGVEYSTKVVAAEPGRQVRLQIWDTAGQELFRSMVKSFYKGISAIFLVFSVDSQESFNDLKSWSDEVREYAHEQAILFLIGSKCDIQDRRQVKAQHAQAFLQTIRGAFYIQTSAKNGTNIEQLFKKTAEILLKKYSSNVVFKALVSPNEKWNNDGTRSRGDSLVLRRSTFQRQVGIKKNKKCCQ